MGRRREEKVDEEYLAQLMDTGGAEKIRVKMPNEKVNEMFAIAEKILGGRRVNVVCADGKARMARIPGKMRRRQWVREGDLIIIWPWDFQDSKADVKHRYNKTQALYPSRKGVLPAIVDKFGLGDNTEDLDDEDSLFSAGHAEPATQEEPDSEDSNQEDPTEAPAEDKEGEAVEGSDSEAEAETTPESEEETAEVVIEEIEPEPLDDDDDDEDLESLFS